MLESMEQLLFLELNEINFELLRAYARLGEVPNFAELLEKHSVLQTTSENEYDQLEPWIQWVTAHTGLSLAEHGIYRLGDIVKHDIPQVWEVLEVHGLRVGAISPMNAKNRCVCPAFFVPDPWTQTGVTARPVLRRLHRAVAQVVNDNARAHVAARSAMALLAGISAYARPRNYRRYARLTAAGQHRPWSKAILLDLLLADVFVSEVRRTRPTFASLFLNAGAHIQHHYMFNSRVYQGDLRNPEWYVAPDVDPLVEVYSAYDEIIGQIREEFPAARLMLATGLHQDPHDDLTFYWRLKDHSSFLRSLRVPFEHVEPRMSRDFLVSCASTRDAIAASEILSAAIAEDGERLFEVDNRGTDLFVMLTYSRDIGPGFVFTVNGERFPDLADSVAFVALKNGEHNGIGYFLDTGVARASGASRFPLRRLSSKICDALGVEWERALAARSCF